MVIAIKVPHRYGIGPTPGGEVQAGWKVPSPLPNSTLTVPEYRLATATSRWPSPLPLIS